MADGRRLTAVQLQMEYLDLARKYVEDRYGSDADAQTVDVLARWESVLGRLETDPMLCARELDWVAKLQLLEQYRDRDGLEWDDAKLHLIDLQYADIRPDKGLYHRLVRLGRIERLLDRRGGRGRDGPAPDRHPGLLPRTLPREVRRPDRRRLLGLGHLRPAGPRRRCSGCPRSTRCGGAAPTWANCSTVVTRLRRCSPR